MMNPPSGTFEDLRIAMRQFHRGDRAEARQKVLEVWERLGEEGDAFSRCVAAHYLADMQDDADEELAWDSRALQTAESNADDPSVRNFLPSLYLSLADDYRRMSDFEKARELVDKGLEHSGVLGFDRYAQTVREGLTRVDAQVQDHDSGPAVIFDFD